MNKSRLLFFVCLAVALCGCWQRSADIVPSGSFRLVVDDMVKDESFRVASLKVLSMQPGTVSVDTDKSHAAGVLLISAVDKLREGRVFFIASRATDSHSTNAFIQASLQVKAEGGDGGMLVQGSFQSGGTAVYPVSENTKLDAFSSMTAKSGIYPLDTPLEIGRIDGKAVTLTVGKPTK